MVILRWWVLLLYRLCFDGSSVLNGVYINLKKAIENIETNYKIHSRVFTTLTKYEAAKASTGLCHIYSGLPSLGIFSQKNIKKQVILGLGVLLIGRN